MLESHFFIVYYAPINGFPQDGGGGGRAGNPRELDFVKRTGVGLLKFRVRVTLWKSPAINLL